MDKTVSAARTPWYTGLPSTDSSYVNSISVNGSSLGLCMSRPNCTASASSVISESLAPVTMTVGSLYVEHPARPHTTASAKARLTPTEFMQAVYRIQGTGENEKC